jgi:hypothetical protein
MRFDVPTPMNVQTVVLRDVIPRGLMEARNVLEELKLHFNLDLNLLLIWQQYVATRRHFAEGYRLTGQDEPRDPNHRTLRRKPPGRSSWYTSYELLLSSKDASIKNIIQKQDGDRIDMRTKWFTPEQPKKARRRSRSIALFFL